MKNNLIIIVLFLILCSCGQKGWDSTYGKILKVSFMGPCAGEDVEGITKNSLSNYCECVWSWIIEEYTIDDMNMVEGSPAWNNYLNNIENKYAPACSDILELY